MLPRKDDPLLAGAALFSKEALRRAEAERQEQESLTQRIHGLLRPHRK